MDVRRLWVYASGSKQRMAHRLLSYLSYNLLATLAGLTAWREFDAILLAGGPVLEVPHNRSNPNVAGSKVTLGVRRAKTLAT